MSDERLDELYREHPGSFVAGRDRLAKELRAAGDREGADRVKRLRRPTMAAWLINRVALSSPELVSEFDRASRELGAAQERTLTGADESAEGWRAATAREREATAALIEAAESGGREAGQAVSAVTVEGVNETVRAATADAELRALVVRGRVEREGSGATLGTPAKAPPRKSPGSRESGRRQRQAQARRDVERLQEELEGASAKERQLSEAVERTAATLKGEKQRLAEAKRAVSALKRRLRTAERAARD